MIDRIGIGGFKNIKMIGKRKMKDKIRIKKEMNEGGKNRVKRIDRKKKEIKLEWKGRKEKERKKGRRKKKGMKIFNGIYIEK